MLKPFFSHRTPQEPLHPTTLSMVLKKIKHDDVLLPCACGRFIHFSHPFLIHYATLRFASLLRHYFVQFISPTSAPHSKSGSFSTCFNLPCIGFPCHGIPIGKAHRQRLIGIAQATPSQPPHLEAFRSIPTFALCRPS